MYLNFVAFRPIVVEILHPGSKWWTNRCTVHRTVVPQWIKAALSLNMLLDQPSISHVGLKELKLQTSNHYAICLPLGKHSDLSKLYFMLTKFSCLVMIGALWGKTKAAHLWQLHD